MELLFFLKTSPGWELLLYSLNPENCINTVVMLLGFLHKHFGVFSQNSVCSYLNRIGMKVGLAGADRICPIQGFLE